MIITLSHKKFAPIGIMDENEKPRPIFWLTEESPICEISESHFTMCQLELLKKLRDYGQIVVSGSSFDELFAEKPDENIYDSSSFMDVSSEMQEEIKAEEAKCEARKGRSVAEYLTGKVKDIIARFKDEEDRLPFDFFRACLQVEAGKKKPRKRVVKYLREMAEKKASSASVYSQRLESRLNEAYQDLIEETYEESAE